MSSKFAKSFLTTTITTFYSEVENFTKSKNIDIPPVSEFLQFIEFEAETKKKRSTAAPTRGKVSKESDGKVSKESDSNDAEPTTEEHCTFVGSRGGKCKSVPKKDCNGMCKKHFDQSSNEGAGVGASSAEKKTRAKSTVKTGKGLSSVVSKALDDSDMEDEPEVKVQARRTKPIDSDSEKVEKTDSKNEKKAKTVTKAETESKNSYVPITFNRDSTSFVYDENADDGFVYKKGEYDTVYAVRHRGVAVKPTRVHIEEIKKAGKAVGSMEEDR